MGEYDFQVVREIIINLKLNKIGSLNQKDKLNK